MRAAVRRRQKISRPGLGEPDDGFAEATGQEIAAGRKDLRFKEARKHVGFDFGTQVAGQDGFVLRQVGLLARAGEGHLFTF